MEKDKRELIENILTDIKCDYNISHFRKAEFACNYIKGILEENLDYYIVEKAYHHLKCAVCNAETKDSAILCDSCKVDMKKGMDEEFDPQLGEFIKRNSYE